jgi:GAF domain/HAMP domain
MLSTPLSFPSADGPGRSGSAAAPSDPDSAPADARPWPLAPAVIGALCSVAVFSIVLHDGLGLRVVEQALLADEQERAAQVLQTIEMKLRLDSDNAREVAAILAHDPAFLNALHNARGRETVVEPALRESAVDGVELVADAEPVSSTPQGSRRPAIGRDPGPDGSVLRNRDGALVMRFVERIGSERSSQGSLAVERRVSGQMIRDLTGGLGLEVWIADADGILIGSAATAACFAQDQITRLLTQRPSAGTAQSVPGKAGCIARSAAIGGRRVALLAQLPDASELPGVAAARRQLGSIAAVTLAVAALGGVMLARRLGRPIRTLSARAESLAVRYTGRAVDRSGNEMHRLAASFDAMTAALLSQLDRLKGLHLDELQNSLELQRRYALMRLLRDLSTAAHECESLEQVLERALEELGGYLDWPIGRVLFVDEQRPRGDPDRRSVWFATERERFAGFISASEALPQDPTAQGLIGRANATGMPHWVTDLGRLEAWRRRDLAMQSGLKSGFVIPIAASGSTHAFIEFFSDHRVEASAEMLELIEAIHSELWQAGERRRDQLQRNGHDAPPAGRDSLPELDTLG